MARLTLENSESKPITRESARESTRFSVYVTTWSIYDNGREDEPVVFSGSWEPIPHTELFCPN